MKYEHNIQILKNDGFPAFTGLILTHENAEKIKSILDERKKKIDNYYFNCIKTRVK